MNESRLTHTPRPEFRAMLEDEVVRAFHREARFAPRRWYVNLRGLRAAAILMAGLVLGFTTEFASGQVQDAQERERLLQAANESRQLMGMRLNLAEEALKQARERYDIGVIPREALLAAEQEVREMQMRFMQVELEIAEIRASSAPPRDELWAPLVNDRDFVSEKIRIEAAMLQTRLRDAERRLEEVRRSHRIGTAEESAVLAAEADVADARRAFELAGLKLQLRKQFFEEKLASDEVERRYQRYELFSEMERAQRQLRLAEQRLEIARNRARAGAGSELEAKRAEVEVLELQLQLRAAQQQLRRLEALRKEG
jgi:outer membrane protein TolC